MVQTTTPTDMCEKHGRGASQPARRMSFSADDALEGSLEGQVDNVKAEHATGPESPSRQ